MVEEAAWDFFIPETVQVVFYAMVVNKAFALGVVSRDLAKHLKLCLKGLWRYMCEAWLQLDKLDLWWAQHHRQANPGAGPRQTNDREEDSKSSDALAPSIDDE